MLRESAFWYRAIYQTATGEYREEQGQVDYRGQGAGVVIEDLIDDQPKNMALVSAQVYWMNTETGQVSNYPCAHFNAKDLKDLLSRVKESEEEVKTSECVAMVPYKKKEEPAPNTCEDKEETVEIRLGSLLKSATWAYPARITTGEKYPIAKMKNQED